MIKEEGYGNIEVLETVTTLLTTSHPHCDSIIGWAHHFNNSRVVYILPGHGPDIYSHPQYRKLISNALKWSVGK